MEREVQIALLELVLPGWQNAQEVRGERRLRCPLHDDRSPSLRLKTSTLVWYCDPCSRGGGVWDLSRAVLGEDEARVALGKLNGSSSTRSSPLPRARGTTASSKPREYEVQDLGPPTEAQIRRMSASKRLRAGNTLDDLGVRRLRVRWRRDDGEWGAWDEWLGFGTIGAGWKCWSVNEDGQPRFGTKGKLLRRNAGAVSLILSPDLRQRSRVERLWDVEGESDLVAAIEAGALHVVTGTGGAGALGGHDRHRGELVALKPDEVVVVGDLDEAGRKGAEKRAAWWRSNGIAVRVVELPDQLGEGGDLRDYFNGRPAYDAKSAISPSGNLAAFEDLVESAEIWMPESLAKTPGRTPILVRMADVEPEAVDWLWEPYIPIGKLTLLEGDPGLGKTWLSLVLAAAVSRGSPLPGSAARSPANVLIMTAEDGLGDTLRPRLDLAEADLDRVNVLDGIRGEDGKRTEVTLADLDILETSLDQIRPKLVIVDPIQGYLGAGVDMNRANEVRPLLAAIARLAEQLNCAIVAIRHLRKSGADRAVHRGLGSIDFSAAVRSILVVAEDPENDECRVVAHSKSNLAPKGTSLRFTLVGGAFAWAGASDLRAEELLATREREPRRQTAAAELLEEMLADGPVSVTDLKQEAKAAGLAWRTVERAKDQLRVQTKKIAFSGGWEWVMPRRPPTPPTIETGGLRTDTAGDGARAPLLDSGGGLRDWLFGDPEVGEL